MKHQYFGDLNDYRKYGILRALSASGLKITICWMLTENDERSDGRHINYLQQSEQFKKFDPDLFEALYHAVIIDNSRNIRWIQMHRLIPHACYFTSLVSDKMSQRLEYVAQLSRIVLNNDLIFFDPDNGIEVKSKPNGTKGSNKYLYWDEIERFWKLGYSLLIYQHFPRVKRYDYIHKLSKELCSRIDASEIIVLKTSTVAFFLLTQPEHQKAVHHAMKSIRSKWHDPGCEIIDRGVPC